MADREPPYDPYIPSGGAAAPGGSAAPSGNQRTAALQAVSIASAPPIPRRTYKGASVVVLHNI